MSNPIVLTVHQVLREISNAERKRKITHNVADFLRCAARGHLSQDESQQDEAIEELSKWQLLAQNYDIPDKKETASEPSEAPDDSNVETLETYTGGALSRYYQPNRQAIVPQELSTGPE